MPYLPRVSGRTQQSTPGVGADDAVGGKAVGLLVAANGGLGAGATVAVIGVLAAGMAGGDEQPPEILPRSSMAAWPILIAILDTSCLQLHHGISPQKLYTAVFSHSSPGETSAPPVKRK